MKKVVLIILVSIFSSHEVHSQTLYFPDTVWQTKKPSELKLNSALLDSAVQFALRNENKVETDLRIACLKAYAAEPGYRFFGPFKHRGKPAGVIIKNG
ncbi:MAG: serine hydrolase, partial [Flammeovirgaceae bacterium]